MDSNLELLKDLHSCVNLTTELLQDVIQFVHHLLLNGTLGLDRLEVLQQLKCSLGTPQLPTNLNTVLIYCWTGLQKGVISCS